MEYINEIKRPSKEEQMTAIHSYNALASAIEELKSVYPEIEIEETKEKIKIPLEALKLFAEILKAMSQGNPISIVPIATEMTTQSAAEFLGCSRPHLVKLLENGEIPFTKVGRHRRVKFDDVRKYKDVMKNLQEEVIIRMMKLDEDLGLYDS
jgi:excisionase family DNA binding protein